MVWLSGEENQIELGQFWIKANPNFSMEEYNKTAAIQGDEDKEFAWKSFKFMPETIAKLREGWTPGYEFWYNRRSKYPWRLALKAPFTLTDYALWYDNQEKETIYPYRMKAEAAPKLRGVPVAMIIYFNDAKGQRYKIGMQFYDEYISFADPDISAVWDIFKKLFPGRTPLNNADPVSEADMASLEMEIDEPMDNIYVYLVKGDKRYRLPVHNESLVKLKPYTYLPNSDPATPQDIDALENGPDWVIKNVKTKALSERPSQYTHMVKAGEICPMEGEWIANHLNNKKMYVKAGEVMPGPLEAPNRSDVFWYRLRKDGEKF
jgi:hypothetical protein